MYEFVGNSSRGAERMNFVSGSCAEGVSGVREPSSWRDCVFSASTVSRVNGCGRLCELSGGISAREYIEWNFESGVVFLDLFSGLLEVMVLQDPASTGMVLKSIFAIIFFRIISFATVFLLGEIF
jgi:hypothetical protein